MNAASSPPLSPISFLTALVFFSIFFRGFLCLNYDGYSNCTSFDCGEFKGIGYPFWGNQQPEYCGHPMFKLDCHQQNNISITIMSQEFHVIDINSTSHIMNLARMDIWGNKSSSSRLCLHQYVNTTLDFNYFQYTSADENSTLLYDCDPPAEYPVPKKFTCSNNNFDGEGYFVASSSNNDIAHFRCKISIVVPVLSMVVQNYLMRGYSRVISINEVLDEGFEVRWDVDQDRCENCKKSGGRCGNSLNVFTCFCSDHIAYPTSCVDATAAVNNQFAFSDYPADPYVDPQNIEGKPNVKLKVAIGVSSGGGVLLLMSIGFFLYLRRYKKLHSLPYTNTPRLSSDPSSIISRDTEKGSQLFGAHLFAYEELEEATGNFNPAKELGDGGFGTVYYGKLHDGREVAVKRLYENNFKRVEQFKNEVEILTRLRHQNLVSLYGCTSRHCRELLLVYEYISNGTVADHLHGHKARPGMLPWQIRINIAIETAMALSYLHASDIIHRDVKTNNILLDKNFRVKVADFGLSRLFPTDKTHISTAPQGTPGYVDPEYHQCYQLTDKSDVYSFGVVLIELISSMPAVDITRHRHEINLSSIAINKIQQGALAEIVDPSLGFESNYKVRKMIDAVAEVAFQCLQGVKDMRPSMLDVLESLKDIQNDGHSKGNAEELDIRVEDAALLKSEPPPFSPESDAPNLRSISTTPNTSG